MKEQFLSYKDSTNVSSSAWAVLKRCYVNEAIVNKNPQIYIIAGPNGAGKTTFAKKFLPQYAKCSNFVNADLIASGLSPFSPDSAAIRAGKLLLNETHALAEKKK